MSVVVKGILVGLFKHVSGREASYTPSLYTCMHRCVCTGGKGEERCASLEFALYVWDMSDIPPHQRKWYVWCCDMSRRGREERQDGYDHLSNHVSGPFIFTPWTQCSYERKGRSNMCLIVVSILSCLSHYTIDSIFLCAINECMLREGIKRKKKKDILFSFRATCILQEFSFPFLAAILSLHRMCCSGTYLYLSQSR